MDNAYILANIGGLYRETKQYEKADRYYREALKLDLAVLGEEHPDTACDFNNLGANLREQNKLAEALPYFDKALKIRLAKLGRQHRLTAKTLMGQAELQRRLKHLDKAEILVRHALDIQSKSLPPGHPEIAEANDILGLILQDRDGGKSGAAVEAFQKALFIREKLLSPDHPDIKNSQEHLQNAMKLAQKPQ
ncbi:MAG: tetratricopeptide repeat protein [Candidatus Competibacteraceae bacterium]|nr:tetratricopeptide repeat protein [Candidatus Competibacteraceae bacterium]